MIGIGGVGMSSLAQLYIKDGIQVSGSDNNSSPTTELLESLGIKIHLSQKKENVSKNYTFVVYSDAVPFDNIERERARNLGLEEYSYFSALGNIIKDKKVIAVAGTHGKTTTTAMIAKILRDIGKKPNAVIGSIVKDFKSNFLAGESDIFVVEACEYRDHFLNFYPHILVITNLEWDHTDFFSSLSDLQNSFRVVITQVSSNGAVVTDSKNQNIVPILKGITQQIFNYTQVEIPDLLLIGEFNRMNAKAAKAAVKALFPDTEDDAIDESLTSFQGTWRRFEKKGSTQKGALVFDDYAHHPTAVSETIHAARKQFKGKRIIVAFHPHLYSRTRDLMDDFAASFNNADEVVLAPIYPAREESIPNITSEKLSEKINIQGVKSRALNSLDEVKKYLISIDNPESIFITMGAGDIYKVAEGIVVFKE